MLLLLNELRDRASRRCYRKIDCECGLEKPLFGLSEVLWPCEIRNAGEQKTGGVAEEKIGVFVVDVERRDLLDVGGWPI